MDFVYLAAIIAAAILISIGIFQVLLSLGFPLGEFAMGGFHRVLPFQLRVMSAMNAAILILISLVLLQHAHVINRFEFFSANLFIWIITIFLGINSLANLVSKSRKERVVMTPISSFLFVLCLFIALS